LKNLRRIHFSTIETLAVQSQGKPAARLFVQEDRKRLSVKQAQIQRMFIGKIYQLVNKHDNRLVNGPVIMEFMPHMSYYCIKWVEIKRLEQKMYEKIKAMRVYKEDIVQSQNLAAVHFNPENILKRMNFRWDNDE